MLWGSSAFGRFQARSARGAVAALMVAGAMVATTAADAVAAPKSAIVVDGKTGKVLYQSDPDGLRHPASLTKMMTLYMLFGALESGKINLNSRLTVSAYASRQAPTKLGLKPGSTIAVRDAMLGLITRSANDAAVVIAENLAGSESAFASRMTATARSLGMTRTTFRNANGLPNPDQWTTARDMVTLGRALQERYPSYYRYFSTRSFVYNGKTIGNHNRLLGKVEGVDGIKTGYTNASGFNIVSSVKRDNRFIVAAVMGGGSAASRDKQMVGMIDRYMPTAYAGPAKGDSMIARMFKGKSAGPVEDVPPPVAIAKPVLVAATEDAPVQTAALAPSPRIRPDAEEAAPEPVAPVAAAKPRATPSVVEASAAQMPSVAPEPLALASEEEPADGPRMVFVQGPSGKPVSRPVVVTASVTGPVPTADDESASNDTGAVGEGDAEDAAPVRSGSGISGWKVQIAAAPSEDGAQSLLDAAKAKGGKALAAAMPSIEAVKKGDSTFYRARFAGFESKAKARAACDALKKRDVSCLAIPD
ncbi:D-alanyl-D-alanine carboxypeptidase [Kaistia soli DSM 19436]|uniref:D-alanyl-D-alanine carboxypeptidase n=1 Tax=Kaistia soli DSM 19436 TaxID=1122133 RepID=A0A1M5H085_9HYPH|nr:D-alanyl-D-alanine carboxypeptidase [Kaistia soli]SHG09338.1 D-alanyl-D-alanine carboxypeptidase [Kaistia soli DSM 19436]